MLLQGRPALEPIEELLGNALFTSPRPEDILRPHLTRRSPDYSICSEESSRYAGLCLDELWAKPVPHGRGRCLLRILPRLAKNWSEMYQGSLYKCPMIACRPRSREFMVQGPCQLLCWLYMGVSRLACTA